MTVQIPLTLLAIQNGRYSLLSGADPLGMAASVLATHFCKVSPHAMQMLPVTARTSPMTKRRAELLAAAVGSGSAVTVEPRFVHPIQRIIELAHVMTAAIINTMIVDSRSRRMARVALQRPVTNMHRRTQIMG